MRSTISTAKSATADDSGLDDYYSSMHYSVFSFAKDLSRPVIRQGQATMGFLGNFANVGYAADAFGWRHQHGGGRSTPVSRTNNRLSLTEEQVLPRPSLTLGGRAPLCPISATSSNRLWHSIFRSGGRQLERQCRHPELEEQGSRRRLPRMIKGLLHMVHLGDSSNDIWHTMFDPVGR